MDQGNAEKKAGWVPSPLTEVIIGAAIEVHKHLGPGLLESVYETCLCREILARGIACERQLEMPVFYKGEHVDGVYRFDLLVGNEVLVEVKAVEKVIEVHHAQLLTYLRLMKKRVGLINFNVPVLWKGVYRRVL